jgi:glycosyltransferase involved in cell wall biosynthesis
VLATLGFGDAIGDEVLGIQRILRAAGYRSEIFVETADRETEELAHDYLDLVDVSSPDSLLIHHFSLGSKPSRLAYALPDRMLLVYHNITPPEYVADGHPQLAKYCFMGRRELAAFASRCELAVGASEFSRQDLERLGFTATGVLPVVPDFSHLDVPPDPLVAVQFDDDWTNILFVGRIIPNKKIEDLIRFYAAYRALVDPRSRLLVAGSAKDFEWYLGALHELRIQLRLDHVHFLGHVSNATLTACYDVADVFLCASEHEGFCVPVIESFYKRVPVLAYAAAAVPATMDGGGVLYSSKDPLHVAALVNALVWDEACRASVLEAQDAALDRLRRQDFAGRLLGFVDRALRAPRRPAPALVFDFWEQVRAARRLRELRRYRPSYGHAFPDEAAANSQGSEAGGERPGAAGQTPGAGSRGPGAGAW